VLAQVGDDATCGEDLLREVGERADRRSAARADSIAGMPRLMQFRKKIRAKLFATTAPTPSFLSAATAYSREEPQPKFSPPTRMSPGRTSFAKPGRASQNA
jgi:hypothetical protein